MTSKPSWKRVCWTLALMSGCAQAPAPKAAEPARSEATSAEPASVDAASLAFEQAERELGGMFPEARPEMPSGAPPAPPPPADSADGLSAGGERAEQLGDRCTIACKALGSMRRSADQLCDLTGEQDPRCGDVRGRVERADERVRQACPTCS